MMKLYGTSFYGNEVSEEGKKYGYLDYACLAKGFQHVLNNEVVLLDGWEFESGNPEDEVFQWFIVSDEGADILKRCGEIVLYNEKLDMYIWGITHFGTSWDYVLTDVKINCGEAAWEDDEEEDA